MKYDTITEEYIEIIGEVLSENPVARVKDIARARGVTLPTASSAVERLKELQLVEHEHYSYVTLTPTGEKLAAELEAIHSAIKEMLVRVLSIPEDVADEDACKLEHHISPQTQNAMANLFFFLENCPKGGDAWLETLHNCCLFNDDEACCRDCTFEGAQKAQPSGFQPKMQS